MTNFNDGPPCFWNCFGCDNTANYDVNRPCLRIDEPDNEPRWYCSDCAEKGLHLDDDELPENVIDPVELLTGRALWDVNWLLALAFLLFAAGLGIVCSVGRG